MGGGFDDAGVASICVDPRRSHHVTIGVSTGGVWVSDDGGAALAGASEGMYADYYPRRTHTACPRCRTCTGWCSARRRPTRCGCSTITACSARPTRRARGRRSRRSARPKFGFAVAVHPTDPGHRVVRARREGRVPRAGRAPGWWWRARATARASFDVLTEGLPQCHAYDLIYRHALGVDDSGDPPGDGLDHRASVGVGERRR